MSSSWTLARAAVFLAFSAAASACEAPASDLREWKPSDHDHTSQPSQGQVDVSDPAQNPLSAHGVSEVALLAWRQNCVRCHGVIGRGDGPQSAMYRPPDLTDPERQQQLSDKDIMTVIQNGRGQMPGVDLPESTLVGLVKLVRLLDSSGKNLSAASGSTAASGSAAPSGSATPTSSAAPRDAAPGPATPAARQAAPGPTPPQGAGGTAAAPPPAAHQ